jgi:hypothetical protein
MTDVENSGNQESSNMDNAHITDQDRAWARICLACPFCQANEKVYGRKAHEPAPSH